MLILSCILLCAQGGGNWSLISESYGDSNEALYGISIAGAGDVDNDGYPDVIIGASGRQINGLEDAGSVFVFSGKDKHLLFQADGDIAKRNLGSGVAYLGDINLDGHSDLLVGAHGRYSIPHLGKVFVYSGLDGTTLIELFGTEIGDGFGGNLDGCGDVNGDNYPDFIVGAPAANPRNMQYAGSVYIFSGKDGSTIHQVDGPLPFLFYGTRVSGIGDVNGDDFDDFAQTSSYAGLAGSVHVHSGLDGSELYRLDGSEAGEVFGNSLDGIEDVNLDGYADFVAGATRGGVAIPSPGKAYVISGNTGTVLYEVFGEQIWDFFGGAVAGLGDVNGDGRPDFGIGATSEQAPGTSFTRGAVRIYSGVDGSLIKYFPGGDHNSCLGFSLAGLGDLNDDGFDEVIFGDPCTSQDGLWGNGYAQVYSFDPFLTPTTTTLSAVTGGSVDFQIDFPDAEAGKDYALLVSGSAQDSVILHGVEVPLANHWTLQRIIANGPPPMIANGAGTLDANGQAMATLTLAPNQANFYVGRTIGFAAVSLGPIGHVNVSSARVLLQIVP